MKIYKFDSATDSIRETSHPFGEDRDGEGYDKALLRCGFALGPGELCDVLSVKHPLLFASGAEPAPYPVSIHKRLENAEGEYDYIVSCDFPYNSPNWILVRDWPSLIRLLRYIEPVIKLTRHEQVMEGFDLIARYMQDPHSVQREAREQIKIRRQEMQAFDADLATKSYKAANPANFVPWPADQPPRYNGKYTPCDMWTGPCSCGATHERGK